MADTPPQTTSVTRREFVAAGAMTAAWMIVPRHVLGQGLTPPSDLVNIAVVGFSGMGAVNAQAVMSQNVVAICDVDEPPPSRPAAPPPPTLRPRLAASGGRRCNARLTRHGGRRRSISALRRFVDNCRT